ncbi:hypothetical protein SAMN02745221_00025 [Thermosyntropha lipolytica DSM 11003]|uniref:Uncharacterized protein n=1 Tax=Thermosyntropha lipolytica DSM 11003 TaxID=1123382 RepID=A0A1M5J9G5_9FIRM|nr:hypothetical protein [Thermosyntropha lipolytica]SHG37212.1 hypothetical protein SAMN02745221_00025 [Thermosyntropha lipolytica DSM 11003]
MRLRVYGPLILLLAIVLMFFSVALREFLKITFILGMPFIFLLGFWFKRPKYSAAWFLSLTGLVLIAGLYGYMLVNLPEKIEVRKIIIEGANLEAEGKYDQAIARYKELGRLGKKAKMEEKISQAEKEKKAYLILQKAKELIKEGQKEEGLCLLDSIPEGTRAYHEAQRMKREYQDDSSG